MTQTSAIRSFFLAGPAGRLEALLNEGAPGAKHAALVCHPHPLFGGTMHNKVVFHAMKTLNGFGFPVLRFNFRGAGLSEGTHDDGRGEVEDVRAALAWLEAEFHLPILFAGFSFGAAAGLRASCPDPRVDSLIALGTPVRVEDRTYGYKFLLACTKPKLLVSGALDPFGPRHELEQLAARVPEPKKLVIVEGADHFFAGHLAEMRRAIEEWVRERVASF
ncbi:MAG: alpha/beta hydrolase [Acidobacteriia bacterium]|nr:alpha/beta hydrolase [Terriglobia bacterium]